MMYCQFKSGKNKECNTKCKYFYTCTRNPYYKESKDGGDNKRV